MTLRHRAKRLAISGFTAAETRLNKTRGRVLPGMSGSFYLISAAGLPNYGDEFITRGWLRYLAENHPGVDVWLDCLEPGRAAFLFGAAHPRLRTTNTLWQLAAQVGDGPAPEVSATMLRLVRDLGTPRLDPGLEALRSMRSIHLLGGGYVNRLWQNNVGLVHALAAMKNQFGIPVFATGQGLLPQSDDSADALGRAFAAFDFAESRDSPGAELMGISHGVDDAFLDVTRPGVFDPDPDSPDVMVLIQGDMIPESGTGELVRAIERFVASSGAGSRTIGFVEAIPPDDSRFSDLVRDSFEHTRFYPFSYLWSIGLPARPGQQWLTTRFHIHLLAAAGGAHGAYITGRDGYYDVKHASLAALGTGWTNAGSIDPIDLNQAGATGDPGFVSRTREYARAKQAVAHRLYPGGVAV